MNNPSPYPESEWTHFGRSVKEWIDTRVDAKVPTTLLDIVEYLESRAHFNCPEDTVDAYAARVLRGSLAKAGKRKGNFLRKAPTGADGTFLRMFRWHAGSTGGSLWGPMMEQFRPRYQDANTLAIVLRIVLRMPMASMDRWREVLGA